MKKFRFSIALMLTMAASTAMAAEGAMSVYKSPWCGCCTAWVEAMKKAGHQVSVHEVEDLDPIKQQAGIPAPMQACHTAIFETGGRTYIIEGHVPMAAIDKLVAETPEIHGIAVPGMPQGSLGMGDDPSARYSVFALTGKADQSPAIFYQAGAQ